MNSGDDKMSCLWQYKPVKETWAVLSKKKSLRWQCVRVVEERPQTNTVVLLVCEALSGHVVLMVLGPDGEFVPQGQVTLMFRLYSPRVQLGTNIRTARLHSIAVVRVCRRSHESARHGLLDW